MGAQLRRRRLMADFVHRLAGVETFIPQPPGEAFDEAILHGSWGGDKAELARPANSLP